MQQMRLNTRNLALAALAACIISGCASNHGALVAPQAIISPYNAGSSEVLWAIAPLHNESGTTEVDAISLTDKVTTAAEEIRGVRTVPLNRTLEAMRSLALGSIRNPGDARRLAQAMGVDGVIVGSVTAYDPYTPTIGLTLALFARPGAGIEGIRSAPTPRQLEAQAIDNGSRSPSQFAEKPLSVVSEILDAKDHQVLMDLRSFAAGRSDSDSALGWHRYTASVNLYSEFAAYHALDVLIRSESIRIANRGGTSNPSPITQSLSVQTNATPR
jgi:hypothetical protein